MLPSQPDGGGGGRPVCGDPLREALERLDGGEPRPGGERPSRWEPEVQLDEGDQRVTLRVALPGVRRQQVRVRLADDLLTLEADRRQDGGRQGCGQGFVRSFLLPVPVRADAVDAVLADGTLTVTVDKRRPVLPRRVPIR